MQDFRPPDDVENGATGTNGPTLNDVCADVIRHATRGSVMRLHLATEEWLHGDGVNVTVRRDNEAVEEADDGADRAWKIEQILTEALRDALPRSWPMPVTAALRLRSALEREGLLR